MKLSDLAQIAEIFASIAVVATLIVLVFEIRSNTEATVVATYDSLQADLADMQLSIILSELNYEIDSIIADGNIRDLTPVQRNILSERRVVQFKHYERAYSQWRYGNLDDEAWERFERIICQWRGEDFEREVGAVIDATSSRGFVEFRRECTLRQKELEQN